MEVFQCICNLAVRSGEQLGLKLRHCIIKKCTPIDEVQVAVTKYETYSFCLYIYITISGNKIQLMFSLSYNNACIYR